MSFSKPFTERAPNRGETVAPPVSSARPDGIDLAGVLRILRAQWFVVLACLALFVGAAVAYGMLTPKVWRASARVLLDPRDKQLVGEDVARQTQGIDPGWVATRLELVKSYDTLAEVVKKENLVDDPEVYGPAALARSSEDPVGGAVRVLSEMVLVERPKENDLIDVTVSSKSPAKAARLANAVARSYVDGLVRSKVEQIEHANTLLSRQVDEMRSKMLAAEERVEAYKREHGIAVTRGTLIEEETLRQSNDTLLAARTRMQEARERSERLSKALAGGDPTLLSQTDPVGSAVITRLKIEAAMADRRKADLEQTLGPRHPRVLAAAAESARARAQILDEVKSLAATADLDYQVARANEENARKGVERAQAGLSDMSRSAVGLQELQNEANARRDLYKSFVSRMEETTLQRNTQVSDGRIVSPAQIPMKPFSPRATLALALGLVAGLGSGLSLALYRGRDLLGGAAPTPRRDPLPPVAAIAAVEPSRPRDPLPPQTVDVEPPPPQTVDVETPPPVASEPSFATSPIVAPEPSRAPESSCAGDMPAVPEPPAVTEAPVAAETSLAPEPLAAPSLLVASAPSLAASPSADLAPKGPDAEDFIPAPLMPSSFAPEDEADLAPAPAHADAEAAPETVAAVAPEPEVEPETAESAPEPQPIRVADLDASVSDGVPAPETAPAVEAAPARPTERVFRDAVLPLSPDRIARLADRPGPGTGVRALVEAADGGSDLDELAALRRLAEELATIDGVRVIFSNTVPSVLTAALALGFARAAAVDGRCAALVDLAHEEEALDPVFAAAEPAEVEGAVAETWEQAVDGDLLLWRPLDPVVVGDAEGHPRDLAEVVAGLAGSTATVLVHLGRLPTAALLFDAADGADHVTLVIDEKDRGSHRVRDEIEVVKSLLTRFDGLVVLEGDEEAGRIAPPRRAAGRVERSGT